MSEKNENRVVEGGVVGAIVGGVGGSIAGSVGIAGLVGVGTAFSLPLIIPGAIVLGLFGALIGSNIKK